MTKQRFSEIEDAILVGLLDCPSHDETPFKIDPNIFSTPLKKKIALTINKFIDNNEPEMAMYTVENTIDETPKYQDEWINVGSNAMKFSDVLSKKDSLIPVSMIKNYYRDLISEHNSKLGDRI